MRAHPAHPPAYGPVDYIMYIAKLKRLYISRLATSRDQSGGKRNRAQSARGARDRASKCEGVLAPDIVNVRKTLRKSNILGESCVKCK